MPDIRYHFVYLIAVFLMLGVGMLVGASFVGPDQIKRQTTYIRDLRALSEQTLQQARASQDQLGKAETLLDGLRPALVHGRLGGRRVTLVQTGDYADATQDAADALRDAGAAPIVTLALSAKWATLDDTSRSGALSDLAHALCAGTAADAQARALQSLKDQRLVTVTGDLNAPCGLFVLVGGARDDTGPTSAGALDGALIGQLQAASQSKAVLVGCEPLGAGASFVPAYQGAQIATVDCIDRPEGQLALPFALLGGADTDDYGLKPTAKRLLPASLESQTGEAQPGP